MGAPFRHITEFDDLLRLFFKGSGKLSLKGNVKVVSRRNEPQARSVRGPIGHYRKPFWLPAISYYFLAIGVTIAVFFMIWWLFDIGGGNSPWIPSGVFAGSFMVFSVYLREVVLRNAMARYLAVQSRLDQNIDQAKRIPRKKSTKLSLKQNRKFLEDIERKSSAARTLRKLPDVHLEIFEVCDQYLRLADKEMDNISIDSPRFGAIRTGRRRVKSLHRYHLLSWAEIESRGYSQQASKYDIFEDKIDTAQTALTVLDTALQFYPQEPQLIESAEVIREFISSAEISKNIQDAEDAVEEKDYKSAVGFYKEALFNLARQDVEYKDSIAVAEKINAEIVRLCKVLYKNSY